MAKRATKKVKGGSINRRRRSDGSWSYTAQVYRRDPETGDVYRGSKGTFNTEAEAERAITLFRYGVTNGKATAKTSESDPQRLDLYLESWLQKRERKGNLERRTLSDLRQVLTRYVIPALGHLWLTDTDLTTDIIGAWVRSLTHPDPTDTWSKWRYEKDDNPRPLSAKTAHKALYALHNALSDSKLPTNPAKLNKDDRPRKRRSYGDHDDENGRWPAVDEVEILLDHASSCGSLWGRRVIGAWYLAAHTGMRRAEVCGASWNDLDWENATLEVRRTVQIDGGVKFLKGPKSANGYRVIDLLPPTMEALRLQCSIQEEEREKASRWEVQEFDVPVDFMFRDLEGACLNPDGLTQAFLREWSGASHANLPPGPSLHSLRHTAASAALAAGENPSEVAFWLGDDLAAVLAHYRHSLPKSVSGGSARTFGESDG